MEITLTFQSKRNNFGPKPYALCAHHEWVFIDADFVSTVLLYNWIDFNPVNILILHITSKIPMNWKCIKLPRRYWFWLKFRINAQIYIRHTYWRKKNVYTVSNNSHRPMFVHFGISLLFPIYFHGSNFNCIPSAMSMKIEKSTDTSFGMDYQKKSFSSCRFYGKPLKSLLHLIRVLFRCKSLCIAICIRYIDETYP